MKITHWIKNPHKSMETEKKRNALPYKRILAKSYRKTEYY